jgi:hypothetical protein
VLWDRTKATALWAAIKADQPIGSQTAASSPSTSAVPVQVAPARIIVQVSNGGGVSGAGAKAANDLTKLGFVLAGPATNSTLHGVTQTLITYDPRYDVSLKTLQAAYPDAAVKAVKGQGRTFQLVVGTSYQAPKAVAAATATTPTTPGGIKTTSAAQTVCKTS